MNNGTQSTLAQSPNHRLGWRHYMEWRFTFALFNYLGHASWETTYSLARRLGDLAFYLFKGRREVALDGLKHALNGACDSQGLTSLARTANRNFLKSRFEFFRLATMSREDLLAKTTLTGAEYMSEALSLGKGVLLVSLHLGSWEVMGARLVAEGFPITAIARPQNNAKVSELFDSIQIKSGMKVVSKFNSMRSILRALRANEVVGLLPDQHAGAQGIPLDFFGRRTPMHPVVALVALRTGAAVVPGIAARDAEDRINVTLHPPLALTQTGNLEQDLRDNTATITRLFESYIRQYPDQWLWMHRRWRKSDLDTSDLVPILGTDG